MHTSLVKFWKKNIFLLNSLTQKTFTELEIFPAVCFYLLSNNGHQLNMKKDGFVFVFLLQAPSLLSLL